MVGVEWNDRAEGKVQHQNNGYFKRYATVARFGDRKEAKGGKNLKSDTRGKVLTSSHLCKKSNELVLVLKKVETG